MEEKKVLLVEDEPDIIEMYRIVLEGGGVCTEIVKTRMDAWEAMQQKLFSLVLLDIIIPHASEESLNFSAREGFKLLEDIRSDGKLEKTNVIVLTNLDSVEDRKRAQELQSEFIVKAEIIPRQLLDKVIDILDRN